MNNQNFNLLTQEEINATVAEVLAEHGLQTEVAAKPASNKREREMAAAAAREVNDLEDEEDRVSDDISTDDVAGVPPASGGGASTKADNTPTVGRGVDAFGADSRATDTKTGEQPDLAKTAADGNGNASMPGPGGGTGLTPDNLQQAAINTTKAQAGGAIGDPSLEPVKGALNPKLDADAAEVAQQAGEADSSSSVNMRDAFHQAGQSSLPNKVLSALNAEQEFATPMSIVQVLDIYTQYRYWGDGMAMQQANAKSHWLGVFRGLVQSIDTQDTPELKAAAEERVKRQLDSLLYQTIMFANKTGTEVEVPDPPGDDDGGGDDGGGDDGGDDGGGDDTPKEPEENPIPINKFPPRGTDPETGKPVDGKRTQPLRSKLSKAGLNPQVINTVMRAITKQLQSQDVPFTESMRKQVASLVIERLLVKEIKNIMLSEKGNPDDFTGQKDTPLTRPKRAERPDQAVNGKYFMAWLKKLRKKSGINFEPTAARSAVDRVLAKAIGPTVGISEAATGDPSVIRYTDLHKALMKVPYAGEQEGTLSADEADKLGKLIMNALQEDPKIVKQANIRFEMPGDAGEDPEPEKEEDPEPEKEEDPEPEPGPEHHKYGQVPDLFKKYWDKLTKGGKSRVGDMSAEEAWKNLPSGKEGKKRQNVAESLLSSQELLHFAKLANLLEARVNPRASGADDDTVMPKTGQGRGTSRKDLDRSVDKFGQGRKPAKAGYGFDDPEIGAGSDDYEITKASFFSLQDDEKHSEMRSFVGGLVNKLAQNVKGRDASKGGFGGDTFKQARGGEGGGTIKMSTMNQQLKANGVDRTIRKQVMGIVQKHLKPYLKKHKIKLSEAQINQFFGSYIDKLVSEHTSRN